jgi:hypothetical protein
MVTGVVLMTDTQYEKYTRTIGHLPVLSKSYILGHTVPMPTTDKNGRIHVSDTDQTPRDSGQHVQSPRQYAKPKSGVAAPAGSARALLDQPNAEKRLTKPPP